MASSTVVAPVSLGLALCFGACLVGCFADPLTLDEDGGSGTAAAEAGPDGADRGTGGSTTAAGSMGPPTGDASGTDGGATEGSGTQDTGLPDPDDGDSGAESGASTDTGAACDPGTLGCACEGDTCSEGTCSVDSGTCVALGADDMVLVAGGVFTMGCHARQDPACEADAQPQHDVDLSPFEIDRLAVSVGAYLACVDAAQCAAPGMGTCTAGLGDDTLPVTCLLHADAANYCAWVDKRLPTEAEWEKAARGPDGRTFPWGEQAPDCTRANFNACGGVIIPPGLLPAGASPYGALDMAGNVWELVADAYDADYYAVSPGTDPTGPAATGSFVLRGGFANSGPAAMRATARLGFAAAMTGGSVGFRCARDAD